MTLLWCPTPYRRSRFDEYADVKGYGRFRVKPIKAVGGSTAYEVTKNNQRVGLLHDSASDAKAAVAQIVERDRQ